MKKCYFILVLLLLSAAVGSQTDTIGLHGNHLATSALKPALTSTWYISRIPKNTSSLVFGFG